METEAHFFSTRNSERSNAMSDEPSPSSAPRTPGRSRLPALGTGVSHFDGSLTAPPATPRAPTR